MQENRPTERTHKPKDAGLIKAVWILFSLSYGLPIQDAIAAGYVLPGEPGTSTGERCHFNLTMGTSLSSAADLFPGAAATDQCGNLSIKTVQDMVFGKVANLGGGQVTLHPRTGVQTTSAGLISISNRGSAMKVIVAGIPGKTVRMYFPESISLTAQSLYGNAAPAGATRLENITHFPAREGTFDNNGKLVVYIGGTLRLSAYDVGDYSGDLQFEIEYE